MINYVDYEMADGTIVKLAVTMKQLVTTKSKNEEAFELINSLITFQKKDGVSPLETALFLYGVYIGVTDADITLNDFYEAMNQDIEVNAQTLMNLVYPKKNRIPSSVRKKNKAKKQKQHKTAGL